MSKKPDYIDRMILIELVRDSRTSLRSIASKLNLGVSTVYTRIRKLVSIGVLTGFTAEVDLVKLGMAAQAIVEVKPKPQSLSRVFQHLMNQVEVVDVYEVSGEYPIVAKVISPDDVSLAKAIEKIASHEDLVDIRVRYIFQTRRVRVSDRLVRLLQSAY
ncbi:MAG: Lrp/AsnC family transcriptional regulator [Sulfolobales archaeon]|nr:Lrp/AsnC family transcriptional regulator [Sulfolobales archaeon]MCX8208550.1 Lrp/AsnC family transcriptional regulator [Sulfolobales archaeon]MDW8010412.1 Lrp/AsnC family transcriptional regulator [Sulfolobales archaeon]